MAALVKKYPETGSEALWSYINENIFEGQKQQAIESRLNYAFETNFSSENPMKTSIEFQNAGYQIHLVFMGFNSLEESSRVSEETIRYNYEFGYKNLYKYVTQFDLVTLFDNGIALSEEPVTPQEILRIENGKVYLQVMNYPAWVIPIIQKFPAQSIARG
ncbi:hypothetical protein [Longitalea arenae]|uniref:hypothetical protein n=1 Tax=Longitalea arenae TaxID=2812558 RepID=UPI0019675753|nr:hypothetical protein [Longitalea arenae]